MSHPTPYTAQIAALRPDHDPRHIEAFMRLQYGTLDHLSPELFLEEVGIAVASINADPDMAERLALSYGL